MNCSTLLPLTPNDSAREVPVGEKAPALVVECRAVATCVHCSVNDDIEDEGSALQNSRCAAGELGGAVDVRTLNTLIRFIRRLRDAWIRQNRARDEDKDEKRDANSLRQK